MLLQFTFPAAIGNSTGCKLEPGASPLAPFLVLHMFFPSISLRARRLCTPTWGKRSNTADSMGHKSTQEVGCSAVDYDCFPLGNPFPKKPSRSTHFKEAPSHAVLPTC